MKQSSYTVKTDENPEEELVTCEGEAISQREAPQPPCCNCRGFSAALNPCCFAPLRQSERSDISP
jgi:hypothetical protein